MRFRTYYSLKYSNMIDEDRPGQDQKRIPFAGRTPASKCSAFHPWICAVLIPSLVLLLSCSGPERIIIFHAGSLSMLVERVIERFQANHPNVVIHAEASGSLDAVRKVSELKKPCDLVATADWRLIERFPHTPIQFRRLPVPGEMNWWWPGPESPFKKPASRARAARLGMMSF